MIRYVVTRGYGNGVFPASIRLIPTRGYLLAGVVPFRATFRGMWRGVRSRMH